MTHNIIKTENYLLAVDDSEIKQNDWCIYRTGEVIHYLVKLNTDNLKKITAHLPLNNSPVLEGVPLLPPLEDDEAINKAKEKYNADLGELLSDFYLFATNGEVCDHEVINEFIQSLQQPKMPVGFECEDEYVHDDTVPYPKTLGTHPKTIVNPQGQTVLVGKYIY